MKPIRRRQLPAIAGAILVISVAGSLFTIKLKERFARSVPIEETATVAIPVKEQPKEPPEGTKTTYQRLRLPGDSTVLLPNNDISDDMLNPEIKVLVGGRTAGSIPIGPIRDKWLADDAFWGSHQKANDLRYEHNRAGILPFFTDARVVGDKVWALLSLYIIGASSSGQWVVSQAVVTIAVHPQPKLTVLRHLREDKDARKRVGPAQRVFNMGKTWLLHDPPDLFVLGDDGLPRRTIAVIPKSLKIEAFVDHRWLVLVTPGYDKPFELAVLDIGKGETRPRILHGPWDKSDGLYVDDARGSTFRLIASSYTRIKGFSYHVEKSYRITLPGRKIKLENVQKM